LKGKNMTNTRELTKNANVIAALAAASSFSPSGKSYMKFNANTGIYTYGKEEKELTAGSELAVNMKSFALGWICWKDEKVEAEIMAMPFAGQIPITNEADLPDHGPFNAEDGWSKQASVEMKILDTGEDVLLKLSSSSGVFAMNELLRGYAKELSQQGDDAIIVVSASSNGFMPKEKKYGKKYAPVFEIVEWTTEEKLSAVYSNETGEDESSSYEEPTKAIEAPKEADPVESVAATTPEVGQALGGRRRRF
jgi:hypothetical protein